MHVASSPAMFSTFDIVEVSSETGLDIGTVARVHFRLGHKLQLHWLRDRILGLPRDDRWKALSRAALRDDLYSLHRQLTGQVLQSGVAHTDDPDRLVDTWITSHPAAERTLETLADIHVGRVFDLTTLPVAVREIRNLLSSPAVRPGT